MNHRDPRPAVSYVHHIPCPHSQMGWLFCKYIKLQHSKQHCKLWNFINTLFTTIILNHSQVTLLCVGYIRVPNINNFSQQHDTTHFIILDWGLVRSGTKRYTFNIIQSNPPRFYKKKIIDQYLSHIYTYPTLDLWKWIRFSLSADASTVASFT